MTREIRCGTHKLYKGKYFIVFYDRADSQLLHSFDNVREILRFQNKPITRQNVNYVNVELYVALKNASHFTRFLTGEIMRVYIIEADDENTNEQGDLS